MSEKKVKWLRRELRRLGVPPLAGRVGKRLRRAYRATAWRERAGFGVLTACEWVSKAAFAAFWGRLSPSDRVKYMKRLEEKKA